MVEPTDFKPPETDLEAPTPNPTLWRVLVRPLQSRTHTDAGLELTKQTQENQQYMTVVGQIIAMGPTAFQGGKFEGSRLEVGTWVLFPNNAGQVIEMADGRRFSLMNDDAITAVVDDPEPYRKKLI